MTRKHYEQIARILRWYADSDSVEVRLVVEYMAASFAAMCKADNPNFDARRFYEACDMAWLAD